MTHEIEIGNSLCVFPEGTISKKAPEMNEFKKGAFAIAIKKQVPVLPVVFTSNYKRMQRSGFLSGKASPGIADVQILEPVRTTGLEMDSGKSGKENICTNAKGSLSIKGEIKKKRSACCNSFSIPSYKTTFLFI